ncbi:MAG: rcsC [Polaromonas sp.]|nr:rcsC [Polaromonas sp.]
MTATPLRSWQVVVIDDSPDDRSELHRLLLLGSDRRWIFIEAETGTAGIKAVLAAGLLPDCVLLDYNLPDMDALDVLDDLAGPDGLPVCPVVVLTGGPELEAGRMVLRAGAQDYIAKDWLTPPVLTRTIENAIERLAMARELLDRNAALRRSEKSLAEADRRKDEFIATLAHELRNPLAPVRTALQVLRLSKNADTLPDTLDIMERQLAQMARLIDDLLDVSRITTGKVLLRPEHVLVSALVDAAVEAARPHLLAGHHTLKIDLPALPLWLEVDPARLTQVIGNLLNNSAKYSGKGGVITVAARQEGGDAVIRVSDAGLGIPDNMLVSVFDMFTQVNQTLERAQGGLGIGLALVKQLVEMHGGTVVAESAGIGKGSTFVLRLPVAAAPAIELEKPASLSLPLVARRILVVDDSVDGAQALARLLALSGHSTRTAFDGPEALAVAIEFSPEIVFLDIGLPGMNGYEVARRFRAMPALKDALLVALTGWGSEGDRRRSSKAGFDLHLTKPAKPSVFDAVLAQFEATLRQRGNGS